MPLLVSKCPSGTHPPGKRIISAGVVRRISRPSPPKCAQSVMSVGLIETTQFCKVLGARRRSAGVARHSARLPDSCRRPDDAGADAETRRPSDRGFHSGKSWRGRLFHRRIGNRRGLPYALVSTARAAGWAGDDRGAWRRLCGARDRRATGAGPAGSSNHGRSIGSGVQVHGHATAAHRHGLRAGRAGQLYRGPRLRDLVPAV